MHVVVVVDLATGKVFEVIGMFLSEQSAKDWAIEQYGDKIDEFTYYVEHVNHP